MHLAGFIIKKFVTMHGHTSVKFYPGHPPANFYNPVSLRLPSPLRFILISIGHVLVDLQGKPLSICVLLHVVDEVSVQLHFLEVS